MTKVALKEPIRISHNNEVHIFLKLIVDGFETAKISYSLNLSEWKNYKFFGIKKVALFADLILINIKRHSSAIITGIQNNGKL